MCVDSFFSYSYGLEGSDHLLYSSFYGHEYVDLDHNHKLDRSSEHQTDGTCELHTGLISVRFEYCRSISGSIDQDEWPFIWPRFSFERQHLTKLNPRIDTRKLGATEHTLRCCIFRLTAGPGHYRYVTSPRHSLLQIVAAAASL